MSEGVPVASLYYSDSPWSCAGELMTLSTCDFHLFTGVFVHSSVDSVVGVSPQGDLVRIGLTTSSQF